MYPLKSLANATQPGKCRACRNSNIL